MSIDFDTDQKKVINHRGKPLVVLAGPGTGKTAVLVERIVRILESSPNTEVSFITFTRTSRRDAERRIENALSKESTSKEPIFPRIATLYMFAKALVHQHAALIGVSPSFRVLAPQKEDLLLIKEVIEDLSLSMSPQQLRDDIFEAKSSENYDEFLQMPFQAYESLMKIYNAIDISNLVYQAVQLFQNHGIRVPGLYLHVDEYQDLNPMDQKFIDEIIKSGNHGVVVCGDDEQSVYGFRHAYPDGIRSIWKDPEWESISFSRCARLPPHILRASRKLMEAHKGEHIDKQMIIPRETAAKITTFQCTKSYIEVKLIAKHIEEIKKHTKSSDGNCITYKDIMILCPTNTIVDEFLSGLFQEGIPVKKKREIKIPDNIWRLFLLVRLAEQDDGLALRQWMEIIGIDESKISQLRKNSLESGKLFCECVRESSDNDIGEIISVIDELQATNKDLRRMFEIVKTKHQDIIENEDFRKVEKIAESSPSATELMHKIYEEYEIIDKEEEISEENGVLITTLHSSKGLEAEIVYIVRADNRFLPLRNRDWDEELRSVYVGMTRTKQMLFFSFHERYESLSDGQKKYLKEEAMSPFLNQIADFIDLRRITVADLRAG